MQPLIPTYLETGDTVLLIGTARARNREAVQSAIDTINSWGFNVECGPNLFKVHHQFAGTDEERASDLQWAIDHPFGKAVLIAGGGYGTLRIIDKVQFDNIFTHPKWFVGYSDTTVLHSRLQHLGIACIHGTMAFQFANSESTESVRSLLSGRAVRYQADPHPLNRYGKASGEIIGGNLSILYSLIGSKDDISPEKKILFIEDLDEQLYHIDRMMMSLKRAGKLNDLAALIVGGMTQMKDNAIPFGKTAEEIIAGTVEEFEYPVIYNFPSGHREPNLALFLNRPAALDADEKNINFRYI